MTDAPSRETTAPMRVLVLGGYGTFGRRLVHRLALGDCVSVVVGGRDLARARELARSYRDCPANPIEAVRLDAGDSLLARRLADLGVGALANAAGPFQTGDYRVARACIDAGVHYVDLADARAFVAGIAALDEDARRAGVLAVSGASSVPALSGAAVDALAKGLAACEIDIGISPGNRTERGLATVASILAYCGAPLVILDRGRARTVHGWTRHWQHVFPPPVGRRWVTHCDVPDLDLLPQRFAGARSVRFGAGLEVGAMHWGLAALAWARRFRLLPELSRFAPALKRWSERLAMLGSDAGAMYVRVAGLDSGGARVEREWHLVAERGDGPYVPTLAAAALLHALAAGSLRERGARPCLGLLSLQSFREAAQGLAIRMTDELP